MKPKSELVRSNNNRTKEWDRKIAIGIGTFIVIFIVFLVIRNEPIESPNLVVLARIILALAVGVFGATIPGFLNVVWNPKGFAIRSGGALALFCLAITFTPKVLPEPGSTLDELVALRLKIVTEKFESVLTKYSSQLDRMTDKQQLQDGEATLRKLQNEWNQERESFWKKPLAAREQALKQMEEAVRDMEEALAIISKTTETQHPFNTNRTMLSANQISHRTPRMIQRRPSLPTQILNPL